MKIEVVALGDTVLLQASPPITQFKFGNRSAETMLNVRDGETIVLGGTFPDRPSGQNDHSLDRRHSFSGQPPEWVHYFTGDDGGDPHDYSAHHEFSPVAGAAGPSVLVGDRVRVCDLSIVCDAAKEGGSRLARRTLQ